MSELAEELCESHKKYLLVRARWAISNSLFPGLPAPALPSDLPTTVCGLFVRLNRKDQLRGEAGEISSELSLIDAIDQFTLNAARDPRFPAVAITELPAINIEITLINSSETICTTTPVHLLASLKPNEHGLYLEDKHHKALFLPQKWQEYKEKQSFIDAILKEGGWYKGSWPIGLKGIRYSGIYFMENYPKPLKRKSLPPPPPESQTELSLQQQ